MQPRPVLLQAFSDFGVTIEAFEPWRLFSGIVTLRTESRPSQESVCLG